MYPGTHLQDTHQANKEPNQKTRTSRVLVARADSHPKYGRVKVRLPNMCRVYTQAFSLTKSCSLVYSLAKHNCAATASSSPVAAGCSASHSASARMCKAFTTANIFYTQPTQLSCKLTQKDQGQHLLVYEYAILKLARCEARYKRV
eukprot:COSAG05_NODE_1550_length_4581_cov_2.287595_2_plen_146_part_00